MRVTSIYSRWANVFLIETNSGLALIDAGISHLENNLLDSINRIAHGQLKLIFITHAHLDHYGSAAALKRITGAMLAIHSLDAQLMRRGESPLGQVRGRGLPVKRLNPLLIRLFPPQPVSADRLLEEGDRLDEYGMHAQVVHTPGHTPGSASLLFDDGSLFPGDLISSNGGAHVQRYFAHDWTQIASSIRKIKSLSPSRIYPGHGRKTVTRADLIDLDIED